MQARGAHVLEDATAVQGSDDYSSWQNDFKRWRDVTQEALRSLYTSSVPVDEFGSEATELFALTATPAQEFAWEQEAIKNGINKLESLRERLRYLPTEEAVRNAGQSGRALRDAPSSDAQVFVVHGQNEEVKTSVARLLERTGSSHSVIILHEQPNQGRTIIEKFEDYATQADHAVVLMTGDDLGGRSEGELRPRARQNVILELGFFAGHLGRASVTVLHEPGVEVPSDYLGVVYIPLDAGGAWKYTLLNELKAAGLTYDLNNVA